MECCLNISQACPLAPKYRILIPAKIEKPGNLVEHGYVCTLARTVHYLKDSDDVHRIRPAPFFLSNSFRKSSIFSSDALPVYLISSGFMFCSERDGRSEPQIISTRLSVTGVNAAPPFFLIFSDRSRASATSV